MRFVIDLDSLFLTESASDRRPVTSVSGKRGDATPFEVIFVRAGIAEPLPATTVLTFGAKKDGQYDAAAVVFENAFTLSGSGAAAKYLANPSFNTTPLNALFLIDGNPANDVPFVDLMAEFTWAASGQSPTSTKTFPFRVYNDVLRGDEGTPTSLPDPADWMPAALTFAGANPNDSVDGLTISGIVTPSAANGFYTEGVEVNGYPSYARAGYKIFRTTVSYTWMLTTDTVPFATNKFVTTQNVATPDLVTEWTPISGNEGELDISLVASLTGTHLGQLCKASDAWWRWDGTQWVEEIADASLTIAKTAGLQAALDGTKPIKIIGCVGDSITDQSSVAAYFRGNGWAANMMAELLPRIKLVGKSSGDYEFGVSGAKAVHFLTGGTQRAVWLEAIASPADTLMICLGSNDCATVTPVAATISAAILTLWTEAQAAGKTVIGMDITSCHASHPSAATYKAAQIAVNLTISEEARTRGMIYVDWARTCDIANDGYTDSAYLYDTLVHPNITGGTVLGLYAAAIIEPFLPRAPVLVVPPSSSDRWITPNPFALGTPGSPATATGWTTQILGGVGTITANLIDGGNRNVGNWQELVVAGVNTANVLLSLPTNYARVYQRNSTAPVVAGAKYRGYCEYEITDGSGIYLMESAVTMESAPRVYSMYADGGLVNVSAITPATRGILLTPEYTATTTGTTDTFHFINVMGNGTVRIRRAGVFRSS